MQINAKSLAEAHIRACCEIYESGIEVLTEDGEVTFECPEPMLIIIENPFFGDMVSPLCKFGIQAMTQYADDLLYGGEVKDPDKPFVYTYHDRLFAYLSKAGIIDQIANIICKLKEDPTSRRCEAVTWYPESDLNAGAPPCLQRMQFMIRCGKLNLSVDFRSNDCLSAINQNMYAFAHLQKYVAQELGIPVGMYTHYITSPHLYPCRDASELDGVRQAICNKHLKTL